MPLLLHAKGEKQWLQHKSTMTCISNNAYAYGYKHIKPISSGNVRYMVTKWK